MKVTHKITLIALLWLIFINPGGITNPDTIRRGHMAHAWLTQTEEAIPQDEIVIHVNNRNYIPYDLGQSMLMLPGDWLGSKLSQSFNLTDEYESEQLRGAVISFAIFLPINLLVVLTSFKLLVNFGYSEKLAGLSSIVLLLGTTVLFYASYHQQNNQILFCVLASYQTALAYVMQRKRRLAIASGMALGIAFFIRITSILYVISVLTFLIGCLSNIKANKAKLPINSLKSTFFWMTGFVPFVLLERILTYYRYGSWTATSTSLHIQIYQKASNFLPDPNVIVQGDNSSFSFLKMLTKVKLEGLLAPLISPEKSVFLYDPLVLPCLILGFLCWRFLSSYIKWYLIAGIIGFILHLYIYSWNVDWIEHMAWGARYHITSVHLLLVPLIPLIVRGAIRQFNNSTDTLKIVFSWLSKIIIILAIFCQLASISLYPSLEKFQQESNIGSEFRIVQRLNNIFYLIDNKARPQIQYTKAQKQLLKFFLEERITWNILPFRYQIILQDNPPLNRFLPLLGIIWGLIFISATVSTIWIFVR